MAEEQTAYCGYAVVVPESAGAMTSRSSGKNQSFQNQFSSKTEYMNSDTVCSSKFTETYKSGAFVDGRNGNPGYREEVNYKSSVKVNDKIQGCATRYETEVKHKTVTTYNNPSKNSGGSRSRSYGGSKNINYY